MRVGSKFSVTTSTRSKEFLALVVKNLKENLALYMYIMFYSLLSSIQLFVVGLLARIIFTFSIVDNWQLSRSKQVRHRQVSEEVRPRASIRRIASAITLSVGG